MLVARSPFPVVALALLLPACHAQKDYPAKDSASDSSAPPVHIDQVAACDNLDPHHCLLPWPSDRYLVDDPAMPTGKHVAYDPAAIPAGVASGPFDATPYTRLDGMSAASQILAMFDRPADLTAAAGHESIELSLDPASHTVLFDLTTGERVAHWVENDAQADSADRTILFMRPTGRLQPDHDYAVAYWGLTDADGVLLDPSPAIAVLRARGHTDAPDVEARWQDWQDMADTLDAAGVPRDQLQMAWRFHTGSDDTLHKDVLAMRADAIDRLGPAGIGCNVTSITDDFGYDASRDGEANSKDYTVTWRQVSGTYTVPSYMTSSSPPALLNRDGDGNPVFKENAEVPFTAIVPESLANANTPGPLVTFGHGLLGDAASTLADSRIRYSAEYQHAVFVGTDWAGMSTPDLATVATILGDVSRFPYLSERLEQSMVNQIALTRTLAGVCTNNPAFQTADGTSLIDPTHRYYAGVSQGGILGGTYLTLAPDIDRGALIVNGAAFPFMMERSIAFSPYFPIFVSEYPDRVDRAILLSTAQQLWDTTDPSSYLQYTTTGLGDIGPKTFVSLAAMNDAQVPNLTSDYANRTAGIPILQGSARTPYGFDVVDPATASTPPTSAYITIDVGDPPPPDGNEPPTSDAGGHSNVGVYPTSLTIMGTFFNTGTFVVPCNGVCDPD